jgi:hypothetical protein
METWIIGKNASILTYPDGFFDDKNTIGMNDIAILFKTKMAFSCYPFKIKDYLSHGITLKNIIGVEPIAPSSGVNHFDRYPNLFPGILNDPIKYHNSEKLPFYKIEEEVDMIFTSPRNWWKNDYIFHNHGTSLQLLIFWCMLHDRYPLHLCGCNQTTDCASNCVIETCKKDKSGFCVDPKIWEESRLYTQEVVRCINLHGDYIKFHVDYNDFLKKELKNDHSTQPMSSL